ncbi:MAG: AGE family epimerase/isomerase [bacterium]
MTNAHSYANWQPLLLESITVDTLRSDAYRQFILNTTITPGCRLLLQRHRRHPDWPYVETKFNPNTGLDLPETAYGRVYAWFLGRGSEAMDVHLAWLDRVESLTADERDAIRDLFSLWRGNMTDALLKIAGQNSGRIPFRVNRELNGIDATGRLKPADPAMTGAGDIFAVKGLISNRNPVAQAHAMALFRRTVNLIRLDRFEIEQSVQPAGRSHGPRMLMQGVGSCISRKALDPVHREEALEVAALFLGEVLDAHYDPATCLFSEYVDPVNGSRGTLLDPGHATELVGLGLGMVERLTRSGSGCRHAGLLARAKHELPQLLLSATSLGFNPCHPGMFKAVDNRNGEPLDSSMPWWNLPETMRAAVRAVAIAETEALRTQCLEVFRLCHNAYFTNYLNRDNMLFPYQSLDGKTGKVTDVVPAVPEGDPLYHANGAFLDMLEVIEHL